MNPIARSCARTLVLLAAAALPASAQVSFPSLFGDHMVAQSERPFRVWGHAPAGSEVTVTLWKAPPNRSQAFIRITEALEDGTWAVEIEAQPPGGPYELTIATPESKGVKLTDVWFGEVWLCSGQSNMEWPLSASADAELHAAAADAPNVRLFKLARRSSAEPLRDVEGTWTLCSPESAPGFSAVGYHFGRAIEGPVGRPIGLIQSAWGGTPAEAWTSPETLAADADFAPILEREPPNESWLPAGLYNGMLAPLFGLELAGVIWYQGESNAGRAEQYGTLFPAMIRSWREAFPGDDLPFLFVQLANFKQRAEEPGESDWAELREAQGRALELPRTAVAVIIDVGDANDIHPRDKLTVGERLALAARRIVYGEKDLEFSGPTYASMSVEGPAVRVRFEHAAGLATTDERTPVGFALAGADRVFHWADAVIDGADVVLLSEAVPEPVAVRFAWADNPDHNLVNAAGLPASPFRSDDWPGVTAGKR